MASSVGWNGILGRVRRVEQSLRRRVDSESSARDFGASAVLQALNRVPLLRRALLLHDDSSDSDSSLFGALSSLTKKIWNEKNFKGHSSPPEFARAAGTRERRGRRS